jgi:hypothetical protein
LLDEAMTRHLQRPYRIWPLSDLEEDNDNTNKLTKELSSFNLDCPLSLAKYEKPYKKPGPPIKKPSTTVDWTRVTIITSTCTAAAQVLNLTEMLEAILLQLTPTSLYYARDVCEYWRAVIEASPILLRRLWPETSTPITVTREYYSDLDPKPLKLNPILEGLHLFASHPGTYFDCYRRYYFADATLPLRIRSKKAYWREMQLTEPPVKQVFLRSSWLEKYIFCETGVTAGQVADLLEFREGRLYFNHC